MSLLFNTLSEFVIAFLPRSKHLLISWLQSPSEVILEPKKIKPHHFPCFPIYLPWSDGIRCMILVFWMLSFKPAFSLSSFTLIKRLFSSSLFFASGYHLHIRGCWYFSQQYLRGEGSKSHVVCLSGAGGQHPWSMVPFASTVFISGTYCFLVGKR